MSKLPYPHDLPFLDELPGEPDDSKATCSLCGYLVATEELDNHRWCEHCQAVQRGEEPPGEEQD